MITGIRAGRSARHLAADLPDILETVPVERPGGVATGLSIARSEALPTASWVKGYQRSLLGIDLLAAVAAVIVGFVLRFGSVDLAQPYLGAGLAFPLIWAGVIAGNRGYDARCLGNGPDEFQRIGRTFVQLIAAVAIVSYALKADISRGFVLTVLPAVFVLDSGLRYILRKRMHRRRLSGQAMSSVIVVGSPARVAALTEDLRRDVHAGLRVVGACLPSEFDVAGHADDLARMEKLGIALLGEIDDINQIVRKIGADTVAVTSSGEIGPEKLRWISWQLEGTDAELAVSPGLIDVAGTRISVRQAAGLPLLYVDAPRFSGPHQVLKGAFDRIVSATALLLLAPVLVVIALIVRATSHGPALFVQTRVGRNGELFRIVKFRSMYLDAEARLAELQEQNEASDGLLFKIRNDPRVTRVGHVLRRYSLDELPQLLNVLTGSMSMVGPRPPLQSEVASYGDAVRRRLLVKPGLTGLWQVSGRSDLSWEDSVRLDLRYVENWSLAMDMMLLWKTARAVLGADGAY